MRIPRRRYIDDTVNYYLPKGRFLGGGRTSLVELLDNGLVVKTAWTDERAEESQADLRLEARVHRRLQARLPEADYTRLFVRVLACDPADATLTMEHMENGRLRDYLRAHPHIDRRRRYRWILAMAEGLKTLHALNIVHCDLEPTNMLLDRGLEMRIADFAGSSMDGSVTTSAPDIRYCPGHGFQEVAHPEEDLFALGSSMFEVLTGQKPLADISRDQVKILYRRRQFADLTGLDMADIIRDCWLAEAHSAESVYQRALATIRDKQQRLPADEIEA